MIQKSMTCGDRSSLLTGMKHIAVLLLLSLGGLLTHFITVNTVYFCRCNTSTKAIILLSFFGPGLAVLTFAVSLQKRNIFCNLPSTLLRGPRTIFFWKSIFMSVYPSLYWVAILMIDGQYYNCYKSMCWERDRHDYSGPPEQNIQSQIIGLILILLLISLVLLYLCIERCCRPVAWRLDEEKAHALQKEKEECFRRYALALAKHTVSQREVRLYETPLQHNPNKTPTSDPTILHSIPRNISGHDVVRIINCQPLNTLG